jgi:hypothetical protein
MAKSEEGVPAFMPCGCLHPAGHILERAAANAEKGKAMQVLYLRRA